MWIYEKVMFYVMYNICNHIHEHKPVCAVL